MIGIFDSGVGGLFIYRKLKKSLSNQGFVYLADQAYAPYGYRTRSEVVERSLKITDLLVKKGAKLIVVACNTATVNAIDELRQAFGLPIVGIEPAVKPALAHHQKVIVLATHSTVKNRRYHQLVKRFVGNKAVWHVGATELVSQVELGSLDDATILKKKISKLIDLGATALVIGCTHFSYLKPLVKSTWSQLEVFDGADGVVKRVESMNPVDNESNDYFFRPWISPEPN